MRRGTVQPQHWDRYGPVGSRGTRSRSRLARPAVLAALSDNCLLAGFVSVIKAWVLEGFATRTIARIRLKGRYSAVTIPAHVNPNMITAIRSLCFFMGVSCVIERLLASGPNQTQAYADGIAGQCPLWV